MSADPVYEAIAAFAAGLVEHGVEDVVISPGSRSTPLSITLHAQPGLTTWIQLDERSAGFFALGQAKVTGRPSVLVCTSGTAAANYLPAVVEAHHAGVPLIVCTADRPPELRDWGAGQTIDQVGIFGSATRWAADLPVAGDLSPAQARMTAHRAVDAATGEGAGPVHLNWPLREPLEPVGGVPVVEPRPSTPVAAATSVDPIELEARGVIVVGPDAAPGLAGQRAVVDAAFAVSARTGWPVIGEPIAGVRRRDGNGCVVAHADHLLKVDAIAESLVPDVVIRVGGSPTTKPVRLWMERHRPATVLIDPARRWNDASFTTERHLAVDPVAVLAALASDRDDAWAQRWEHLESAAAEVVAGRIDAGGFLSARVTRSMADAVPGGTLLMTSNSMPVRDLDAFVGRDGPRLDAVGNRGASGIDGITSTALGLASRHDGPVVLYTGDLALLHDLGALYGAVRAGVHLTIVCVDNDGGGIFSMLPIAGRGADVDFETLFRTPHGIDLAELGGTGGVTVTEVSTEADLRAAIASSTGTTEPGVDVVLVRVDRDADVAQRRAITEAVRAGVS
ncbi:MAG: 2-succinyl-5-enolpyruvyl-6-hydroxy-3-cyclohexene-1-carboxylic-acid synthase [Actinomycetota bacterium]